MLPKQLEPLCLQMQSSAGHGMTAFLDCCVWAFPRVQFLWVEIKVAQLLTMTILVSLRPARDKRTLGHGVSTPFIFIVVGSA